MATACGSSAVFSGYMYTLQQTNSRIVDTYFDDIYFRLMTNKVKDYKKQLFEMVNADIGKDEIKKLREQRKKELKKSSNKTPPKEQTTSKRKKKNTK